MKDLFSGHAHQYATFRPVYPVELYQFIFRNLKNFDSVWDCGTGNGQAAKYLSAHFKKVYATDISREQLTNAFQASNIYYSVTPAEKTSFSDHQFDLITVAQALHWFDRHSFYKEVRRVAKPGALLAVWGYSVLTISPQADAIIMDFYRNIIGPYWDEARKLVDEEYKTIDFPFEEIKAPKFNIYVRWTIDELRGYLTTWSSTQKYIRENGINPVEALCERIKPFWELTTEKTIKFPVFMRLGKL